MTSGVGVPVGAGLAAGLCALRAPVYTIAYAVRSQTSPRGVPLTLRTHATDSGGVPVSYHATGLPPGLALDANSGVITGTPTSTGRSSVVVLVTDGDANAAATRFSWSVVAVGAPQASHGTLAGVSRGRPRLAFTIRARPFAAALRSVGVALPRGLRFVRHDRSVTRGLLVKVDARRVRYSASASGGVLTVRLRRASDRMFALIGPPTLSATRSLITRARRRRAGRVRIGLRVTDARRHTSRVSVSLRL